MASSTHGNLSKTIRDYLAEHPTTTPSAVIASLHEQGTEVSKSLVNKIMYGGKTKGRRRRKRRAAAGARAKSQPMTGTQAIQEYLRRHPHAGPKQIREELGAKGVSVSASLVSAVKYGTGRRSAKPSVRAAARSRPARRGDAASSAVTVEQLLEVKRIADQMGGAASLRRALEALEQFQ